MKNISLLLAGNTAQKNGGKMETSDRCFNFHYSVINQTRLLLPCSHIHNHNIKKHRAFIYKQTHTHTHAVLSTHRDFTVQWQEREIPLLKK